MFFCYLIFFFNEMEIRLSSELQQKETQLLSAQTELVKAQSHAARCEDEAKAHQDVIKGLQVCKNLNRGDKRKRGKKK